MDTKKAIENIELKDKDHLKKWLQESGRPFLIFNALDLAEALPFPEGVRMFQMVLNYYREYRMEKPTGDFRKEKDPINGDMCEVPIMHDEVLSQSEIDRAIYFLNTQKA